MNISYIYLDKLTRCVHAGLRSLGPGPWVRRVTRMVYFDHYNVADLFILKKTPGVLTAGPARGAAARAQKR